MPFPAPNTSQLHFHVSQIGNVACFLEKGTEDDRYDFLDLYLDRWRQEHQTILDTCGIGSVRRRRTHGQEEDTHDEARVLSTTDATFQRIDSPYFQGEFNPYDW